MNRNKPQKKTPRSRPALTSERNFEVAADKKTVQIPSVITVKDLSEKTGVPVVNLISELMKSGILAAINESIDFETAAIVCDDLGIKCEPEVKEEVGKAIAPKEATATEKTLRERPPVVTIMGHVDHGKTSLLDRIRLAQVAQSESGGITQHISAYQVEIKNPKKNIKNRLITFIDTPGHAAFSALRSHGTAITDIVVLIVAADDGVMPQTVEVIDQCKKHNVPMIVAINKVDLPDADVMKVKQQLADHELLPEEWGGKTLIIEISAKTGQGVDDLLELISLQADLMELKADYSDRAFGVVIESHMQKGAGPLALVLIENGTLHLGDTIQIGNTWGRVRILEDFLLRPIKEATPSTPVRLAGLKDLPSFGEHLIAFDNEKEAKEAANRAVQRANIKIATARKISDDENKQSDAELEYRIILKTDAKGSLDAIKKLISEVDTQELNVKIIGEGMGAVSESDITLAKAVKAQVFAFRVPILFAAKKISEKEKVKISSYDIIYELMDDIKAELSAMLPPQFKEDVLGRGSILAVFRNDKKAFVAGAKLDDGKITSNDLTRFYRGQKAVFEGRVQSLRREKDQVNDVQAGVEFGLSLETGAHVEAGDKLEVYKVTEVPRKIE